MEYSYDELLQMEKDYKRDVPIPLPIDVVDELIARADLENESEVEL